MRLRPLKTNLHSLIRVDFLKENESFFLSHTSTSSTKPNKGEYLVVSNDRTYFGRVFVLRRATKKEALNEVFLKIVSEFLIRNVLPEFDNHFPPNQLKYLVDPERSLAPLFSLDTHHLHYQLFVLHHLDISSHSKSGEDIRQQEEEHVYHYQKRQGQYHTYHCYSR
jgi:hypothetical protein